MCRARWSRRLTASPRIAIVGAHRDTKLRAPYDSDWGIWSCSPANENELPRQDVWFELHSRSVLEPLREYREFLSGLPLVYMQDHDPEFPGSRPYPLSSMLERFGSHFLQWTPCFMLALAIDRAPETIGLWGFSNMRTSEGFGAQRLCLQHFIAMARREGIRMILPPYLDEPSSLYGYDR